MYTLKKEIVISATVIDLKKIYIFVCCQFSDEFHECGRALGSDSVFDYISMICINETHFSVLSGAEIPKRSKI